LALSFIMSFSSKMGLLQRNIAEQDLNGLKFLE